MKRKFTIVLPFVVAFIICGSFVGGWLIVRSLRSNEELASKSEWSVVQAVESQHRDKPGNKIEVVKMDRHSLVGIPVNDTRKEIWIMLNPQNPPYYKQIPQGAYTLSRDDLKNVLASNGVNSTVANCLKSHVEDSK
jgi:hypothetical protein